jgi:hypothetical protein
MAADPDMASNVIGSNPIFASNPELQVRLDFFFKIVFSIN